MNQYRSIRDAVWACEVITGSAKLVALRLVEHWPSIFPSISNLCKFTGLSERTVRDALRELEDKRVISTQHRDGTSSTYSFVGVSIPDLGTPAESAAPPRQNLPDPPAESAGPTPAESAPKADNDLSSKESGQLEAVVARKQRAARKVRMPDDFAPNAGCMTLARELNVDLRQELPQFIDHHAKNASCFADWQAALRTWIRNAQRFGGARRGPSAGRSGNSDTFEYIHRKATEV